MEKIVAANLKMNMTLEETNKYINEIGNINNKNLIIFPSSLYLPFFVNKGFSCGSQNAYSENKGAFTGEISPMQLKSLGVEYVILGHSERRQILNETNEIINKKVNIALINDLNVILCIGETKEQYEQHNTNNVLKEQITKCLKNISFENTKKIIIAYEPIWSIGTGVIPTNEIIHTTTDYIKEVFKSLYNGLEIRVLYGGSVNDENIESINTIDNLSGVLVGGASMNANKLNKIKEVVLH